jgi:hypothetical protein
MYPTLLVATDHTYNRMLLWQSVLGDVPVKLSTRCPGQRKAVGVQHHLGCRTGSVALLLLTGRW